MRKQIILLILFASVVIAVFLDIQTRNLVSKLDEQANIVPTPINLPVISNGCVIAGCSGQLCVESLDQDIFTTCEWLEKYACYAGAKCERQLDNSCGWTETPELLACIDLSLEIPELM